MTVCGRGCIWMTDCQLVWNTYVGRFCFVIRYFVSIPRLSASRSQLANKRKLCANSCFVGATCEWTCLWLKCRLVLYRRNKSCVANAVVSMYLCIYVSMYQCRNGRNKYPWFECSTPTTFPDKGIAEILISNLSAILLTKKHDVISCRTTGQFFCVRSMCILHCPINCRCKLMFIRHLFSPCSCVFWFLAS